MTGIIRKSATVACVVWLCGLAGAAEETTPIRHRFLCVDNAANRLVCVDEAAPSRGWSVAIPPGSRDLQRLGDQAVLVSHGNGAAEYELANGAKRAWVVDRYRDIQSARRLADGKTLLASVRGELFELDKDGREVGRVRIDQPGLNMRLMRVLDSGSLLIGAKSPSGVLEVTRQGKVVRRWALPGSGYTAEALGAERVLSSQGAEAKIVEMDAQGKVLKYVGGKADHPEAGLDFCSGWERLANGNIVMANWLGHLKGQAARGRPHLVEFSPDNRIVWTWADHQAVRTATNVLILDVPAAAGRE